MHETRGRVQELLNNIKTKRLHPNHLIQEIVYYGSGAPAPEPLFHAYGLRCGLSFAALITVTMFRFASADNTTQRKPLRRLKPVGSEDRRSSVFDWINGLTDGPSQSQSWMSNSEGERETINGSVVSVEETPRDQDTQHKDELIARLKKEVKVIMEEAVTKRTINLYSTYVSSLCALLHSASKTSAEAANVLQKTKEINNQNVSNHPLTWIREALHMRVLGVIIQHIANTESLARFYESSALLHDKSKSGLVSALLLGPCAVTYRRMSASSENSEANLVRESSRAASSSRPPLTICRQGSSIVSGDRGSVSSRDAVYSLHHNFKSNLIYGKNNVAVVAQNEQSVKGYLSLHKNYEGGIILKWTPNSLMHSSSQPSSAGIRDNEQQILWKQAIHIDMGDIIYIHLHQTEDRSPCTMTLVDCEGVQSAPLQLPVGNHGLLFLAALETSLLPNLRLDPPLANNNNEKILPRVRKRSSATSTPMMDYVFRIVRTLSPDKIIPQPAPVTPMSLPNSPYITDNVDNIVNLQIGRACQSMRQQILARAFFGWLSYCRHLRTVREHLSNLLDSKEIEGGEDVLFPVDEEFWKRCRTEKTKKLEEEFLLRVYWRGIEGENQKQLRRQAWPYLLGVFNWHEEPEPKTSIFTSHYREEVEEWRLMEAKVRKQDEEAFIAARQRKPSAPERESSMGDVFVDEDPKISNGIRNTLNLKDSEASDDVVMATFATNLHRIDKDVERCDRNLVFFSNKENLESLRRVMVTYVRRDLEEGYIQGMCDLLAPLLVVFEDESLSLECFSVLMKRLRNNFPQRTGMDHCLSSLSSLIQVVDPAIHSMLTASSDFTHLYFSYRWFLLDFKRELSYDCTFRVWETIWAATKTFTAHFALFFALAMVTNYRDVIINNNMDFTDMIKFFNEMAERHDCNRLLQAARAHVNGLHAVVKHLK